MRARVALVAGLIALATGMPVASAAPANYTVAVTANPATLETAYLTTLTVTTNRSTAGTSYTTYLYDQTDPSWFRECPSTSCSYQITKYDAGAHTYVGYVARRRATPMYPPSGVKATSAPTTVTWTASTFTIRLVTDRDWLPPGSTSTITARTNKPVDGSSVRISVYDQGSGQRVAECTTGSECTITATENNQAARTFQAYVASASATSPPPNVQASSGPMTITWSVLPDPRRPPNIGGGDVTGIASFDGRGIPPVNEPCETTSFEFTGQSTSAWVNGSVTAYAGPLTLSARGGSPCENATAGGGTLTVSASGSSALGTLLCGPLVGTFARVGTDVVLSVTGDCEINGFEAFRIGFQARGEFFPTTPGAGLASPVNEAEFVGAFTVVPA